MSFKDAVLWMTQPRNNGNEFDKLLNYEKNIFEKKKIRDDYALCLKLTHRNKDGVREFHNGMSIPCLAQLRSASVMRDIISLMMTGEEKYE